MLNVFKQGTSTLTILVELLCDCSTTLTILAVLLLLALSAPLPPLVENTLGLSGLLQASHEPLHIVKAVVHNLLQKKHCISFCHLPERPSEGPKIS